jgi:DNA-binding MarR family transcriptional regulator
VTVVSTENNAVSLQDLADFRYKMRQFLHFSERCAVDAGLHPQQHQLLLQVAGAPDGEEPTISYVAERLGLRHHTVVELSKRCEEAGLVRRVQDQADRRYIRLVVTAKGHRLLRTLAEDHARELYELAPKLISSLISIYASRKQPWTAEAPVQSGRQT